MCLPGPPVNVALRPTGSRNCTLTWSPPVESGRSDESLSSYSIVCNSEQHLDFALSTRANVEDVQFVLIRLLPHNMYNCCLTAVTTVGTSPTVCVKATSLEEGKHMGNNVCTIIIILNLNFLPKIYSNQLINYYRLTQLNLLTIPSNYNIRFR